MCPAALKPGQQERLVIYCTQRGCSFSLFISAHELLVTQLEVDFQRWVGTWKPWAGRGMERADNIVSC